MNIPQFGKAQNPDPYEIPHPGSDNKRTNILMFGGLALVLFLLGLLLFGGGEPAGKQDLTDAIEQTGSSIAIIDQYETELKSNAVINDTALIKVILRGSYQNLGTVYKNTYDEKKTFTSSPKLEADNTAALEAAVKNDTIDSEIIEALKPQIAKAQSSLIKVKANISGLESQKLIVTAQNDLASIYEILEKN